MVGERAARSFNNTHAFGRFFGGYGVEIIREVISGSVASSTQRSAAYNKLDQACPMSGKASGEPVFHPGWHRTSQILPGPAE